MSGQKKINEELLVESLYRYIATSNKKEQRKDERFKMLISYAKESIEAQLELKLMAKIHRLEIDVKRQKEQLRTINHTLHGHEKAFVNKEEVGSLVFNKMGLLAGIIGGLAGFAALIITITN